MSTAILTGTPVPGSSIEADLRSLGFEVRAVRGAAEAERAIAEAPCGERVALVDARFVGHVHALRLALTDPRFPLSAVPGAVAARPDGRTALGRALARETSAGGRTAIAVGSVADRVVEALDAEGATVHRPALGSLVAAVPQDPQALDEARRAVAAVDDEAVRLKSSVKSGDGFFTTFFISPYSRHLARWCARRGLTPNQVTTASLLTALIAAGCAATGTRGGFVAAGILLIVSFVLDCTDGQLARYALKYSTLGAWLDATFDRAKEYVYYAGLALGAARGGDDVWHLALAAMVLQSVRHMVDFAYHEAEDDVAPPATGPVKKVGLSVWVRRMIILPIGERWAMIAVLTAVATPRVTFYALLIGCAFAAAYTTAGRLVRSLRRRTPNTDRSARALADMADNGALVAALHPLSRRIGVRDHGTVSRVGAVVGVTAPLLLAAALTGHGSRWPLVLAALYVLGSATATALPLKGSLDWLIVPLFRTAEYTTVLLLAVHADVNGALPAAFGLVGAVAYHHYDTVYRIRGGAGAPPAWLVRAIGGQEGRTLLVCVLAALLDGKPFTLALTALAVAVALLGLVESIRFWVAAHKAGAPAVHDEGELA
ncbi:DUF5941 domain-containing protein [Streptomyces sp. ST1015]|uniref:DUF5941 domain-containing protein n=1 Tax=Streptomyces sp. ST1015 TaxID=1848900 RepID=UPI001CA74B49|nr:DUF5941 domain-containing protein [Streptomyces sp. ST1015]QZZ31361.1 CDP-alcohol phosphatidyltransferase family protein [Streptomyces sp. ST1015]